MCITEARLAMCRRQSGLSIIELVVAIVIISVGLVALLIPLTTATRGSGDPLVTKQMIAVAEAMLEEIELKPFGPGSFPGPYTQANRQSFDAVPEYNGFSTVGVCAIDNPTCVPPVLTGFNVAVNVAAPPAAVGGVPVAQSYLITVTVSTPLPNSKSVSLVGFRTNYY